ncbi:dihydroxy-acid dehydratase, partial [Cupriavidus sp. SIMBA_020]
TTGKRAVDLVREDVRPSTIMTRAAFENAIVVASALGASTNCPPHLIAIARHMGIDLTLEDWQRFGEQVPLLANTMPAGEYLGESFHRAGGVPTVLRELDRAGLLHGECRTVSGRT